jgi:hypothetical protein
MDAKTKGLPDRLREHAAVHDSATSPYDDEQAQWAQDLRDAAAQMELSGWRDIATAPKDGLRVLLATPSGKIADGYWSLHYKVWSWPYVMVNPTHWMPAPIPPAPRSA